MSTIVYQNCRMFMGGYELSGIANMIGMDYEAEMLDATPFGQGTRINKPGLKVVSMRGSGAAKEVVSMAPEGAAVGDTVFFVEGVNGAYNPISGAVGELIGFEIDLRAQTRALVRGKLGYTGTATASGNGSSVQLGALTATQRLFAALHVVDPAGTTPTLTVKIQSDNATGFPSATDQITFTQVTTTAGAQWGSVAGPITDDWWRVNLTIAGTSPSYKVFCSFGILTHL
jgi:hypothetical protein